MLFPRANTSETFCLATWALNSVYGIYSGPAIRSCTVTIPKNIT